MIFWSFVLDFFGNYSIFFGQERSAPPHISGAVRLCNGVCIRLERMLDRELLWLACRHHVMELVLAKSFSLCIGPSTSPEIPLFERFKSIWQEINLDNYQPLDLSEQVNGLVESTTDFLKKVNIQELAIRDDYQELVELTKVALCIPPQQIHWRTPGPIHHARWMAKLLYAIKICLFSHQQDVFRLTKREQTQLLRFAQFGVLLYTKFWMEAPLAAEAPANDLEFWNSLQSYLVIDTEIATAAMKVVQNHLWYLSDELVGLALFSDRVTADEKQRMIKAMEKEPGKRQVRGNPTMMTEGVTLGDLASKRTRKILSRLEIAESFVKLPPSLWPTNPDYQNGKERVKALRVVNDTAERGVKLFEEYNGLITNDEEEKQFLLQVVEANRKAVPTQTTKKSVVAAIAKQ